MRSKPSSYKDPLPGYVLDLLVDFEAGGSLSGLEKFILRDWGLIVGRVVTKKGRQKLAARQASLEQTRKRQAQYAANIRKITGERD